MLLAASTFLGASTMHYHSPMLGAFALEFGADAAAVGWVATLTFGGLLAGFVLLVPLGDRFDKRHLILAQAWILVLALIVEAMAPNLATLAAAGFLIGLCASYSQIIVPLVADLATPEERGKTLGTLLSALFLGILFGRITGGFVAAHFGWRWTYLIAAALLCVLAIVLTVRLPSVPPRSAPGYGELVRSMLELVWRHPVVRRIAGVQLLLGLCYGGFWTTIAPMLQSVHGLGPTTAGLMGIPGAAGILIARPAGRWMDRSGAAPVVTTGIVLIMSSWLVLALGSWWVAAVVGGAILLDCGLRAAIVANQTVMNSLSAEARSRSNTVFGVNVWGGNALGAFFASTALSHGWLAVCGVGFLAASAALGVHLALRADPRRTS